MTTLPLDDMLSLSPSQLDSFNKLHLQNIFVELRKEYQQLVEGSKELEDLLDEEVKSLESKVQAKDRKIQEAYEKSERDRKRIEELTKTQQNLRRENDRLNELVNSQKTTIVKLEISNDKLENSDRNGRSTIETLRLEIEGLLEKTALLETEIEEQKEREEDILRNSGVKSSRPQQIVVPLQKNSDIQSIGLDECQEEMEEMTLEDDADVEMHEEHHEPVFSSMRKSASEPLADNNGVLLSVNRIVAPLLLKVEKLENALASLRRKGIHK